MRISGLVAARRLVAALLCVACGGTPTADGGNNNGGGNPPGPVLATVTLTPESFTLNAGQTQQFTATPRDSSGQPFSPVTLAWGALGGTVSSSGLFTAGGTAGTSKVWVTANGIVSDTSTGTVNVLPAPAGDTVFVQRFESGAASLTVGTNGAWQDRGLQARHTIDSSAGAARSGAGALRIEYPLGSDGGWLTRLFMPGWDTIYVSYWVKLQAGWQRSTKLISFYGSLISDPFSAAGKASQCPDGTQWFVTTLIAESFNTTQNPGPTRFYTYYPDMTPDGTGACYGSPGTGAGSVYTQPTALTAGTWQHVEYEVILNTVGQTNASQRFWVNDTLRGTWSGIRLRNTNDLKLNSVTISASVSGGATQLQYMWVDDLVVLRRRP